MANSYSQFSEMIEFETEEQREWFLKRLRFDPWDYIDPADADEHDDKTYDSPLYREMEGIGISGDDNFSGIRFEKQDGLSLWVCSEEGGDLGAVATLVAHYQRTFGIKQPWGATGCGSCSKPRIGEFGGYACVVHLGEQQWINTWDWVREKLKEAKDA